MAHTFYVVPVPLAIYFRLVGKKMVCCYTRYIKLSKNEIMAYVGDFCNICLSFGALDNYASLDSVCVNEPPC